MAILLQGLVVERLELEDLAAVLGGRVVADGIWTDDPVGCCHLLDFAAAHPDVVTISSPDGGPTRSC